MNLLTDVFFLDNLKIIEESKKSGTMTIEGTFQRAEEPNNNKRVYPRAVLSAQVDRLQDLIEGRRLCGELDHPTNETVKLSNASHLITKLWMEGNEVYGQAELLNTPAGKVVQTLLRDGVSVGISSRGLGTLSESANEDGYKTVNDDYKLVTFDLVADPSTKGAFPKLSESVEYFNDTSRNALREKTYVTLLKQELGQRFGDNNMNEDSKKGYGMKHKVGKKASKKRNPEGYQLADSKTYTDEEILIVLENNIRRFISENDDPQLAAQFIRDHSEELMEGLIGRAWAGALKAVPGVGKTVKARRRQDRMKKYGDTPTLDQGGKRTMPDKGPKGEQSPEPEGGDRNLAARIQRKGANRQADRAGRRAAGAARKEADAALTRDVVAQKTWGAIKSGTNFAMGKLKQGWKSAAAKVHGGVAGAQEKVSRAIGVEGGTARKSRGRADAASAAALKAKRQASSAKGSFKRNLRGGVNRPETDFSKKGGDFRSQGDAGGSGPTGEVKSGMPNVKKKDPVHASHDWNVEFNYQMMRLHENIQMF